MKSRMLSLLVILSFTQLLSQNSAVLKGVVRDAVSKRPLPGVNLYIPALGVGTVTGGDGTYQLAAVPAGEWKVTARLVGHDPVVRDQKVEAGETVQADFVLYESFFQMGQMVVTATRSEKLMQDVPVVTEVVSHVELRERGAEDLAQALEDRPGIVVEPNASGGKVLMMNGVDSKHLLILKDGVPIAGKLNSRLEMNLFDIDNVDRIEIVKGPGSALYGSEAMGGVINILSLGFSEKLQSRASLRGGSHDLVSGNFMLSGTLGRLGMAAGMDHQQGGIDKNEVNINISKMKNYGGYAKARYDNRLLGALQAGFDYKEDVQNSDDLDRRGQSVDHETTVRRTGLNLNWDKTITPQMAFKAIGYLSDYQRTYSSLNRAAGASASVDTSEETLTGFRSDLFYQHSEKMLFNLGYDYLQDDFFSVRIKNRQTTRHQQGVFAQMELKPWQPLTLVVGGRYDQITDLEGRFNPRVSALWSVTPVWKFRAAWGVGFRAPNFIDMYTDYRNPYVIVLGNPDLKPESSQGYNFGAEYFWNERVLLNATLYRNQFTDMIVDYTKIPGSRTTPSTMSYTNVAEAVFTGIELQSLIQVTSWLSATLNYNYTHVTSEGQSGLLDTVYPHTASLRLVYSALNNRLRITLRDKFYSARDIKPFDNIEAQDYTTVHLSAIDLMDVTAQYQIVSSLGIRAGVTNLRDFTNQDYGPWIGRRYTAGLEFSY